MAKAEQYRERVHENSQATDWSPQHAVDDRAQSSGQKLANFRADWDAGNVSKETLEAVVTDRLGTGHLSNESRDTLHRYHDRDQGTPLMSWEIKHYRDLMEESTRNFAKALIQNGMSPEETFPISRELRTQYRALNTGRHESGRSQLEGNNPHLEQYSSNHQGEDGQRAVLQFLHQTRGGTLNEHDTTRMLTGNYPDSHMPEERRERLLELHQAPAALDPTGANAREYAELLNESKERLVHIFAEETPWNRHDDRDNRESRYLAEAVRHMVEQHWNPQSEARDVELIYNKNADGSSTHRNRFSNLMLHLDVAGNHMDRPPGHDEHDNDPPGLPGPPAGPAVGAS